MENNVPEEHIPDNLGPQWRQLNEVTWRCDYSKMSAYVMQIAPSGKAWVGRYLAMRVGPTTITEAKKATERLMWGDPEQPFNKMLDPIGALHRMAAYEADRT